MGKKRWIIIFAMLSVAAAGFIFSNSMKDSTSSLAQSDSVAEKLEPFLAPQSVQEERAEIPEKLSSLVRKSAHVVEFCVLGLCLGGLAVNLGRYCRRTFLALPLLLALLVGVTDEYIQSFTGRTSSVRDVLLDFAGGAAGILIVFLFNWAFRKRQENRQAL